MIVWLWIGGGVMALGTILALAPRLRRVASRRPVRDRDAAEPGRDRPTTATTPNESLEEVTA